MAPDFMVSAMRLLRDVHLLDAHLDDVAGLHHLARVLDEAVGQLGDVHEPVLVHADVDEGAERRDVGDDAFELHAGLQVRDLLDALLEGGGLELGARIAAGLLQLGEDVGDGRDAELRVGECRGLQRLEERPVADDRLERAACVASAIFSTTG